MYVGWVHGSMDVGSRWMLDDEWIDKKVDRQVETGE